MFTIVAPFTMVVFASPPSKVKICPINPLVKFVTLVGTLLFVFQFLSGVVPLVTDGVVELAVNKDDIPSDNITDSFPLVLLMDAVPASVK